MKRLLQIRFLLVPFSSCKTSWVFKSSLARSSVLGLVNSNLSSVTTPRGGGSVLEPVLIFNGNTSVCAQPILTMLFLFHAVTCISTSRNLQNSGHKLRVFLSHTICKTRVTNWHITWHDYNTVPFEAAAAAALSARVSSTNTL
jgi:hypothetical protein